MPRPPPPAVALIITGKPTCLATSTASVSFLINPSEPGTVGTPAAFIVSRAVDLSPITRMCSERGPMNSIPWSAQMSTKVAFSDKNP